MGSNLPQNLQAQNSVSDSLDSGFSLIDASAVIAALNRLQYVQSNNGLTAATTQTQAAGTKINKGITRFTSVANGSDAATLNFSASPGQWFVLINDGGNILQLFPKKGDKLNDAAIDAGITLADNTLSLYFCPVAGLWFGGAVTFEA